MRISIAIEKNYYNGFKPISIWLYKEQIVPMVNQPINGKKDGEGSIQAGESPTQPKGSGKASSSRCKKRKFIESWKKDYSWLEYVRCVDYLEHKNKRKLIKRSLLRRYTGTCSFI